MQAKTITIIIDAQGKSTLDLEGFAGQGCEKVFDDFRGGDSVKVERKKPAYYTGQVIQTSLARNPCMPRLRCPWAFQ